MPNLPTHYHESPLTFGWLAVLQPHPACEVVHEPALLITHLHHLSTAHRQQPCGQAATHAKHDAVVSKVGRTVACARSGTHGLLLWQGHEKPPMLPDQQNMGSIPRCGANDSHSA